MIDTNEISWDESARVKETLSEYADMTMEVIEKYLPETNCLQRKAADAARYSMYAGGKRIRPALVMEFCRVCGGEPETALPVACAVEMTHTFSLIHDDLPCMDNDDMRRGKPSCHKAFGEAEALLAGDLLAVKPYEIIAQAALHKQLPEETALRIISLLSELTGLGGMIGGQTVDIGLSGQTPEVSTILEMYRMKTAALLEFCCKAGCLTAGADASTILTAGTFGQRLGLAFQIIDDILDITADEKLLGKPVGSDSAQGKHTYVEAVGLDEARKTARSLSEQALELLKGFSDNSFLVGLTKMLLYRQY